MWFTVSGVQPMVGLLHCSGPKVKAAHDGKGAWWREAASFVEARK